MRFLADENFPVAVVSELRLAGHDVLSILENHRGLKDPQVLEIAQREQRILLTFDKDFGELAFHKRLPADAGVILFRLSGSKPEDDNRRALAAIVSRDDWASHFSVVDDQTIRMRPL